MTWILSAAIAIVSLLGVAAAGWLLAAQLAAAAVFIGGATTLLFDTDRRAKAASLLLVPIAGDDAWLAHLAWLGNAREREQAA